MAPCPQCNGCTKIIGPDPCLLLTCPLCKGTGQAAFPTGGSWVAVSDEEHYNPANEYDTREEAIAAAVEDLDLEPGALFWTGRVLYGDLKGDLKHLFDGSRVIEDAQEQLYSAIVDSSEFCDDATAEQQEELETELLETFMKWLDKHGRAKGYWTLEEMDSHLVPEETT